MFIRTGKHEYQLSDQKITSWKSYNPEYNMSLPENLRLMKRNLMLVSSISVGYGFEIFHISNDIGFISVTDYWTPALLGIIILYLIVNFFVTYKAEYEQEASKKLQHLGGIASDWWEKTTGDEKLSFQLLLAINDPPSAMGVLKSVNGHYSYMSKINTPWLRFLFPVIWGIFAICLLFIKFIFLYLNAQIEL